MEGLRHRGRLKAPNISISPHPHEVACVLNTMAGILAASDNIIRRDKEENSCLPVSTLNRLATHPESLWNEFLLRPPISTIHHIQQSLKIYELILVDIQQILNSNDHVEISTDTIDRRLDDCMVQFQEAIKGTTSPRSSSESPIHSTHFFQNSKNILISGGIFSTNPVVHDPLLREQSQKILRIAYIQCGVLFA